MIGQTRTSQKALNHSEFIKRHQPLRADVTQLVACVGPRVVTQTIQHLPLSHRGTSTQRCNVPHVVQARTVPTESTRSMCDRSKVAVPATVVDAVIRRCGRPVHHMCSKDKSIEARSKNVVQGESKPLSAGLWLTGNIGRRKFSHLPRPETQTGKSARFTVVFL